MSRLLAGPALLVLLALGGAARAQDTAARPPPPAAEARPRRRLRPRTLVGIVLLLVVGYFVMRTVLNPYGDGDIVEVPHGNHSHFVPRDRNPEASISNFPTSRPGPEQCVTRDGPMGVRRGVACVPA